MKLSENLKTLRKNDGLSREELAGKMGVSAQTVQDWEEAAECGIEIGPDYGVMPVWENYSAQLEQELLQCTEEGRDIDAYREVIHSVAKLSPGPEKAAFGDIIFRIVLNSAARQDYAWDEPSELEEIRERRKPYRLPGNTSLSSEKLFDKIYGAWVGRVCGCLLGKPIEGVRTDELIPFLKETNNYPMHRYILNTDITKEIADKYRFRFAGKCYPDTLSAAPADDDTNYTVLAQKIIEKYGRDFAPRDVAAAWVDEQPKGAYCTAERVAFRNFVMGIMPPRSAVYKNPYREWIGAQIRGDYFGYINPGDPEKAAGMAWRDASISHVKNGIYGEMFVSAMIACAAVTDDIEAVIRGGLAQIPCRSRLYSAIESVLTDYQNGVGSEACFEKIHQAYDEHTEHGWCHVISNAMIVTAALLYGKGDYGASVCMAVQTGFDTDCNGATVGSVLGMRGGIACIPDAWSKPINDTLHSAIFGAETIRIADAAKKTLSHIQTAADR